MERSEMGIVDFTDDETEGIRYCKHCLEYEVYSPLKNRLYENNEVEIDHENWLQCHQCGSIYSVNEVQKEPMIKDVVDKIDNANEIGKHEFLSVNPRRKRYRLDQVDEFEDIKEQDLKNALRNGHTLLSYSEEIP